MPAILLLLTWTMTSIVSYFWLTEWIVIALMWLITFDFLTGIFAVIRIDKTTFRSAIGRSKLVDKLIALLIPMAVIIVWHGASTIVPTEFADQVSKACNYFWAIWYLIIILFEAMSILGNIVSAKRKVRVAEIDATEILYKGGMSLMKGIVNRASKSVEKKTNLEDKQEDDK